MAFAAAFAFAIFMHVLLASMTLNVWLLLRRPVYWREKAIPTSVSVTQLALYAAVAVWHVQLALARDAPVAWFFIVATMVLSILVLIALVRARPVVKERFSNVRFSEGERTVLRVYFAVAVATLVATPIVLAVGVQFGFLPWWLFPVAIGVNLPWTLLMPVIGAITGPLFSAVPPIGFAAAIVGLGLTWGPNLVITRRLLGSSAQATATMNCIFLLGSDPSAQAETAIASEPTPEWPNQKEPPPWEAGGVQ